MNTNLSLKLSEALMNFRELIEDNPDMSHMNLASKAVLQAGLEPIDDYVDVVLRTYFMLTPEKDRRNRQNRFWAWVNSNGGK